jgi:DNA-binding NtrC family response regulator
VVEDRASLRKMLQHALAGEGYEVSVAVDVPSALAALASRPFDFVLTDLNLPGGSGLDVVASSRRVHPSAPVVVLTAFGTVDTAVEAMQLGAADFLEKPVEVPDLLELVGTLVGGETSTGDFVSPAGTRIVGNHPRLRAALRLLHKVAPTNSTVLLTGESGTGKELFARALHELSAVKDGPFVAVNCAAIPETLIENELFGHEKGAFTGAHRREIGRFEAAAGGTLFLDEIGDLPLGVQSKVLRAFEERAFERVGGLTLEIDVRLVAATNRDLAAMVEAGQFRSDLFFRLDVFPIELPPLRDRGEDVAALARALLARLALRHGRSVPSLEAGALDLLAEQPWPGNVRQLANLLERALILVEAPSLGRSDLGALLGRVAGEGESERQRVESALREAEGDKRRAAELLGVSYRTVLRRVRAYGLEGYPQYRD